MSIIATAVAGELAMALTTAAINFLNRAMDMSALNAKAQAEGRTELTQQEWDDIDGDFSVAMLRLLEANSTSDAPNAAGDPQG